MTKGKLIVIYGANNLGKSHQAELLKNKLAEAGLPVIRIKYPIYYIEPTGPKINAILRLGLKMPELEVQKLFAQNRKDFEPTLKTMLDHGTWVVAEDYVGTGLAWGIARDLSPNQLEKINRGRLKEDLAILLYGERFKEGIERSSRNENSDELWHEAQNAYLNLAKKYGWQKVYASKNPRTVAKNIWAIIKPILPS